jgi:hypothetical protein
MTASGLAPLPLDRREPRHSTCARHVSGIWRRSLGHGARTTPVVSALRLTADDVRNRPLAAVRFDRPGVRPRLAPSLARQPRLARRSGRRSRLRFRLDLAVARAAEPSCFRLMAAEPPTLCVVCRGPNRYGAASLRGLPLPPDVVCPVCVTGRRRAGRISLVDGAIGACSEDHCGVVRMTVEEAIEREPNWNRFAEKRRLPNAHPRDGLGAARNPRLRRLHSRLTTKARRNGDALSIAGEA